METKENIYETIKKCNDTNVLIDLFYKQINTKDSLDSLPICIKIVNRIKNMKSEYTEEESLVFLEMRNLYILSLAKIYQVMYHLKYEKDLGMTTKQIDDKLFLGFGMISKKEKQDVDVKEFVAKNMVNDMFNNKFPNHKFNIEEDIHRKYLSKDKLVNNGIYKSFLDIIYDYDPFLADFVTCNINILKEVQDKIDSIVDNFDEFEINNEKNRYKYMSEEIKDYCEDHELDYEEYLFRIAAEHNILIKVIESSDKYTMNNYNEIRDIVISASRNDIDINYMNINRIVDKYLKERIVSEKLSATSKILLKYKLDEYLSKFKDMTEEEQLKNAEKILSKIKTNEEYDYAINYLKKSKSDNNKILTFRDTKKGN